MSDIPQYFAQIDNDNIVLQVAVVTQLFLEENPDRYPGTWVETFVDVPGKTYAAPGYIYNQTNKNFVAPEVITP
jgi:hypothetical protein